MIETIQKWGNSQGIHLPKSYLDDLNLREGNEVEVLKQDNVIIIKHTTQKRKTIQELFAEYPADYIEDEELDWGEPVGGEIW